MSAETIPFPAQPPRIDLSELRYAGAALCPKDLPLWERLVSEYGMAAVAKACLDHTTNGRQGWISDVAPIVRRAAAAKISDAQGRTPPQAVDAILALMNSTSGERKKAADKLREMAIKAGVCMISLKTGKDMPPDNAMIAVWVAKSPELVARLRAREFI